MLLYTNDLDAGMNEFGPFNKLQHADLVLPFKNLWDATSDWVANAGSRGASDARKACFKSLVYWYFLQDAVGRGREVRVPKNVLGYLVGGMKRVAQFKRGGRGGLNEGAGGQSCLGEEEMYDAATLRRMDGLEERQRLVEDHICRNGLACKKTAKGTSETYDGGAASQEDFESEKEFDVSRTEFQQPEAHYNAHRSPAKDMPRAIVRAGEKQPILIIEIDYESGDEAPAASRPRKIPRLGMQTCAKADHEEDEVLLVFESEPGVDDLAPVSTANLHQTNPQQQKQSAASDGLCEPTSISGGQANNPIEIDDTSHPSTPSFACVDHGINANTHVMMPMTSYQPPIETLPSPPSNSRPFERSNPRLILADIRSFLADASELAIQHDRYEEEEMRLKMRMERVASKKMAAAEKLRLHHAAFVGLVCGYGAGAMAEFTAKVDKDE